MKKVFKNFLNWFLRNKYVAYILKYGRMENKEKYIEFKNKFMLYLDDSESSINESTTV
jgi:hypothetical protein